MRGFTAKALLHVPEVAALAAMALISYGVSLFCYPAGFIAGGVLLLLAIADSRR